MHKYIKLLSDFFRTYKIEIFLAACWIGVQSWLLSQYGVVTKLEARKYIAEADNIINTGTVSSPNFWLYSTQIFLITAAKKLHTGYISVALAQWFFNALATWTLYKFSISISNKITGFIVALFFILCTPLQTFNSFLQTESLFYSFTIIFSCYLLRLQKITWQSCIAILLFLMLICFTRPSGILWVPCAFLYLFYRFFRSLSPLLKMSIIIVATAGFVFFLNKAIGSGGEFDLMSPFRSEMIICGVPTRSDSADIQTSDNPNSLQGLTYYVTHNFNQFSRLAWLRSKAFWRLTRTYYSTGHNFYLMLYFYLIYILVLISLRKWFAQNKHLLLYAISIILFTWMTAVLTCDDWHNRFFLSIAPYLFILVMPFIKKMTEKIKDFN